MCCCLLFEHLKVVHKIGDTMSNLPSLKILPRQRILIIVLALLSMTMPITPGTKGLKLCLCSQNSFSLKLESLLITVSPIFISGLQSEVTIIPPLLNKHFSLDSFRFTGKLGTTESSNTPHSFSCYYYCTL